MPTRVVAVTVGRKAHRPRYRVAIEALGTTLQAEAAQLELLEVAGQGWAGLRCLKADCAGAEGWGGAVSPHALQLCGLVTCAAQLEGEKEGSWRCWRCNTAVPAAATKHCKQRAWHACWSPPPVQADEEMQLSKHPASPGGMTPTTPLSSKDPWDVKATAPARRRRKRKRPVPPGDREPASARSSRRPRPAELIDQVSQDEDHPRQGPRAGPSGSSGGAAASAAAGAARASAALAGAGPAHAHASVDGAAGSASLAEVDRQELTELQREIERLRREKEVGPRV